MVLQTVGWILFSVAFGASTTLLLVYWEVVVASEVYIGRAMWTFLSSLFLGIVFFSIGRYLEVKGRREKKASLVSEDSPPYPTSGGGG